MSLISIDVMHPSPWDIINLKVGRFGDEQNVFVHGVREGRVYYQTNYARQVVSMTLDLWRRKAAHWIVL